jgi:hypothetical protein
MATDASQISRSGSAEADREQRMQTSARTNAFVKRKRNPVVHAKRLELLSRGFRGR